MRKHDAAVGLAPYIARRDGTCSSQPRILAAAGRRGRRRLAQTFTEHHDAARTQQRSDHKPQDPLASPGLCVRIGHLDDTLSHGWPPQEPALGRCVAVADDRALSVRP